MSCKRSATSRASLPGATVECESRSSRKKDPLKRVFGKVTKHRGRRIRQKVRSKRQDRQSKTFPDEDEYTYESETTASEHPLDEFLSCLSDDESAAPLNKGLESSPTMPTVSDSELAELYELTPAAVELMRAWRRHMESLQGAALNQALEVNETYGNLAILAKRVSNTYAKTSVANRLEKLKFIADYRGTHDMKKPITEAELDSLSKAFNISESKTGPFTVVAMKIKLIDVKTFLSHPDLYQKLIEEQFRRIQPRTPGEFRTMIEVWDFKGVGIRQIGINDARKFAAMLTTMKSLYIGGVENIFLINIPFFISPLAQIVQLALPETRHKFVLSTSANTAALKEKLPSDVFVECKDFLKL